jgi:hypothetical protein
VSPAPVALAECSSILGLVESCVCAILDTYFESIESPACSSAASAVLCGTLSKGLPGIGTSNNNSSFAPGCHFCPWVLRHGSTASESKLKRPQGSKGRNPDLRGMLLPYIYLLSCKHKVSCQLASSDEIIRLNEVAFQVPCGKPTKLFSQLTERWEGFAFISRWELRLLRGV